MRTYIKTTDSRQYAAVIATRAEVTRAGQGGNIVPATPELLRLAKSGAIPTLRVCADGKLGHL